MRGEYKVSYFVLEAAGFDPNEASKSFRYKNLKRPAPSTYYPLMCRLCKCSNQNHKKHRNKTYCPNVNESSSKGFQGRKFADFEEFKKVVDQSLN